jgi:hypothetical protein
MLLEAYSFWTFAQIALIAAYTAAGLLLILSILGLVHLRRTTPDTEVLPNIARHTPITT